MTGAKSIFRYPVFVVIFFVAALAGFGMPVVAQDDVDLSDNAVCLECHADTPWSAPENSDRPRVHQDSGAFFQPDHEAWSCTDCHTDIMEIPHREGIERNVECTNCHETTPE